MDLDFKKISPYELRLKHFEDSDTVSRIDKAKASVMAPKAKDCQRQLNEASSVWAVDKKKFLFIFSEINEEGKQKVSVWGFKSPGEYQRIKTIWVSCPDYIIEAVVVFLLEYFELFILTKTYNSDVGMLYDIDDRIQEALKYTPFNLKQKVKLLRYWGDIMPRFNKMVAELDQSIAQSYAISPKPSKSKGRMKAFFQDKGATYNAGDNFTVAVRKEFIEYYIKLKKGHAVANIEIFEDAVTINIVCGDFADQLFEKVLRDGFDPGKNPKLWQLLEDKKFKIIVDKTEEKPVTFITRDINKSFSDWLEALGDKEVREEINFTIHFFLDLYNELIKSSSPTIKALAKNFYD